MTSFYTSSPTVVVPLQQSNPDQYFHAGHYRPFQPNAQSIGLFNRSPGATASFPPTPSSGCIAGRKRSRGDVDDDIDENPVQAIVAPSVNPIYGPGMTLSYPNDPRGHYASDDSVAKPDRPVVPSRKSQRTTARGSDELSFQIQPNLSKPANVKEPLIDEATRMLGVSWMRMDRYEGGRISQRAYTRWVERHYPSLSSAELWFENSSIPGYFGTAFNKAVGTQDYFIWSFDLKQAVSITTNPSEIVSKLSAPNPSNLIKSATIVIFANDTPVFDNDIITPPPEVQKPVALAGDGDMEIDS